LFVPKVNGRVRICVDLSKLNESVKRERHPLPVVDQTLAQLGGAKLFTKLDANSGFWQIPLAPASSHLTTFITPFGRYRFNRLPFGISSAPEHFQKRMSEALTGLAGTVCMMDDILIHGATREEHDQRLQAVLQRLSDLGMTLNAEKCIFAQTSVKFLGHVVDTQEIGPDPDKIEAVVQFATPTSVGEVRRFLGMVNQLSKFSPNLASHTQPLRELEKDRTWIWEDAQRQAFEKVKQMLVASPILALFDPNLETILSADASSYGLGAVLLQKQVAGQLLPVAYISRSMTPTERRYAQIEKEALAFTWACERLSDYLVGLQFHIQTDHKPLVPLFSTKDLEELPVRVQRFRMRMMRFNFTISHVPGNELTIADALSRAPVSTSSVEDQSLQSETTAYINLVVESIPATEKRLQEIRELQEKDPVCQKLAGFCRSGWPEKRTLSADLKPYFCVSAQLSIANGLLLRGKRIIVPPPLRKTLLGKLHSGHQGITKCRERARQSIWWPGLSKQLEELVLNCPECLRSQLQRPQPLTPTPLPQLPWQKVATDLFDWKQETYLLVVDYFSRYIEIARLNRPTTTEVVTHLKSLFARHGIPETLVSDNGPQYASREFAEFAQDYEFHHRTSSPYFPQGNGEAERAVGTIKSLLGKKGDPYKALLAYRSTPLQIGYSPAELLMGRLLRSTVPTTRAQREPRVPDLTSVRARDQQSKARQKRNHDAHHGARELPPLKPGDQVWIPQRQREGEVEDEVAPHSYNVDTGGDTVRRNRRALIRLPNAESDATPEELSEQTDAEPGEQAQMNNSDTNGTNDSNDAIDSTDSPETPSTQPSVRRSTRHSRPPNRLDPSRV
jgi:transposase InsO family protein